MGGTEWRRRRKITTRRETTHGNLQKVPRQMASKAKLTAVIDAEARGFFRTMQRVEGGLGGVAKMGLAAGTAVAAVGAAAAVAWKKALISTADMGDAIGKMATRTGIGVEALQNLGLAAGLAGTDIDDTEKAVKRMQGNILDLENGLTTPTRAFGRLGIALDDLKGKTPEKQLITIMEALAEVEDASLKAALAEDIFGRSGTKMLPMLKGGAKAFRELLTERKKLGFVITPEQIKAAEDFNDSILRMQTALKARVFHIFAESFGPLADTINELATSGAFDKLVPAAKAFSEAMTNIAVSVGHLAKHGSTIKLLTELGKFTEAGAGDILDAAAGKQHLAVSAGRVGLRGASALHLLTGVGDALALGHKPAQAILDIAARLFQIIDERLPGGRPA